MRSKIFQNLQFIYNRPHLLFRSFRNALGQSMGRKYLRSIDLEVTYSCPCFCPHCYAYDRPVNHEKMIQPQEIEKLIVDGLKLGLLQVNITGGEPLTRTDLCTIIASCRPAQIFVSLCSSGYGMTRNRLQELKKSGLALLILGLDSSIPSQHDQWKGVPGLFETALETIAWAKELGLGVMINSAGTREKFADGTLEQLYQLTRKFGIVLNLTAPMATGRWEGNPIVYLNESERRHFQEFSKRTGARTDIFSTLGRPSCSAGTTKLAISPHGDVYPCPPLREFLGNIQNDELESIWEKGKCVGEKYRSCDYCPAGIEKP